MSQPKTDLQRVDAIFDSLNPEDFAEIDRIDQLEHRQQYEKFQKSYASGRCFMCGLKFWDMDIKKPCSHWLLRPKKFKKKDFPLVYQKFGYHQIASLLSWAANKEHMFRNINNLEDEKSEKKVISQTIVWKNIEWTFDCSESDYAGHTGTQFPDPHYHFQMRVDGRQFINFNDFHVPLTESDINILDLQRHRGDIFEHSFGPGGAGMQQAVEVDPELMIEHMTASESEEQAVFRMRTMVAAGDKKIPGELIDQIYLEHRQTGKTLASLAKKHLAGIASVETVIMPVETVPEIAARAGGRSKKKKKK